MTFFFAKLLWYIFLLGSTVLLASYAKTTFSLFEAQWDDLKFKFTLDLSTISVWLVICIILANFIPITHSWYTFMYVTLAIITLLSAALQGIVVFSLSYWHQAKGNFLFLTIVSLLLQIVHLIHPW